MVRCVSAGFQAWMQVVMKPQWQRMDPSNIIEVLQKHENAGGRSRKVSLAPAKFIARPGGRHVTTRL